MCIKNKKRKILPSIIGKVKLMKDISLSKKLILSYIIIIAVPITTFSFITFKKFENNLKSDIINKNMYQLELETININTNIETIEHTAQMVVSNTKLMEYIRSNHELSIEELINFNHDTYKNMLQLQYSNPNISDINIFTNNKNVHEIWPLVFYEDRIKNKQWYDKAIALNGKVFWNLSSRSNHIYDLSSSVNKNSNEVVSVYRSIDYPKNVHNGIIRVSMPAKVFFSKMYSNVNDIEGKVFIVDNENNIYTNDKSSLISQHGMDKEFIKEQFLKNKESNKNSFNIYSNKKHMVVVYTKIDALDSYMLSVASIDSMLQYTSLMRNIFILATLVLITILSIVTYCITYMILKRLYIIVQSMKKIQQGDFNIEIPVKSNDEIGELAHHFRKMLRKINELIQEAVNKRASTKESELRALQTQIDSHFIYNTLENIKMMAEIEEQYLISDSLTSLGAMMRYNMKWNSEYVTLNDEINHIKNYLSLMNMRFDNKIKLYLNLDDKLLDHELLKMSLQPIIENTVKHGLRENLDESEIVININAFIGEKNIVIEVEDNGTGIDKDKLILLNEKIKDIPIIYGISNEKNRDRVNKSGSTGIGLKNVNERIKLFYGEEYGIEVISEVNKYTKVIMMLPY